MRRPASAVDEIKYCAVWKLESPVLLFPTNLYNHLQEILKMPVPVGGGMAGPSAFDKCRFLLERSCGMANLTSPIVKMGAMMGGSKSTTLPASCRMADSS